MPIKKHINDKVCMKCAEKIYDNHKEWTFSDSIHRIHYQYILCHFCTVKCNRCLHDIVESGCTFMIMSRIKGSPMIFCQKCLDSWNSVNTTKK